MRRSAGIRLLTWGMLTALPLVLGLGACRSARAPSVLGSTTQSSVPTSTSATPMLDGTSGPVIPVIVTVEKQQYAPTGTIVASIHNGLATPIYTRDERSDCTVVNLERWVNNSWHVQAPCVNMQPAPRVVELAPKTVLTQQLAPGLSDSTEGSWPAGKYRISFAYVTSADQPFGQSTVLYSTTFTIG